MCHYLLAGINVSYVFRYLILPSSDLSMLLNNTNGKCKPSYNLIHHRRHMATHLILLLLPLDTHIYPPIPEVKEKARQAVSVTLVYESIWFPMLLLSRHRSLLVFRLTCHHHRRSLPDYLGLLSEMHRRLNQAFHPLHPHPSPPLRGRQRMGKRPERSLQKVRKMTRMERPRNEGSNLPRYKERKRMLC